MDDWKKLKRLLSYLNGRNHLKLRLTALSMNVVECYVDASDDLSSLSSPDVEQLSSQTKPL
jgi:hypothetical protein